MRTNNLFLAINLFLSSSVLHCASSPTAQTQSGSIAVTISGEALAKEGFSFPPPQGEVGFVDGWELKFDRILATIDEVTLSESPDKNPTDQSQTEAAVAKLNGPWAVDLHSTQNLVEGAIRLGTIENQNLQNNKPFDATKRYAFGYRTVAASATSKQVNLDDAAKLDYNEMVTKGWSVLYVGTATFKGSSCKQSDEAAATKYDFSKLPKTVKFRFGFKSPTSYVNCQNPANDPAKGFDGEEHQRGIQVKANGSATAQITLHVDHPFWDAIKENAALRFDQFAIRFVSDTPPATPPTVTLDDLAAVNFTPFTDSKEKEVPRRSCVANQTPSGKLNFDPAGVAYNPTGEPKAALRGYADFMTYIQSTQGHLNGDGLCFTKRNFDAP